MSARRCRCLEGGASVERHQTVFLEQEWPRAGAAESDERSRAEHVWIGAKCTLTNLLFEWDWQKEKNRLADNVLNRPLLVHKYEQPTVYVIHSFVIYCA